MGKKELCASISKFILFVSHLIFAMAAIVLVAIGCLIVIEPYYRFLQFSDVERWNQKWNHAIPEDRDFESKKFRVLDTVVIFMIGFGCNGLVFVSLVYIMGNMGCNQSKCVSYSFAGMLAFIIAIEASMVITLNVYSGECKAVVGHIMRENIETYKPYNATHRQYSKHNQTITQAWDDIQEKFQCCGVDNYTDWEGIDFNNTEPMVYFYGGKYDDAKNGSEYLLKEPLPCCDRTIICNQGVPISMDHGCVTKFENWLEYNMNLIAQIITTIVALQVISISMVWYFGKTWKLWFGIGTAARERKQRKLDYEKLSQEQPET